MAEIKNKEQDVGEIDVMSEGEDESEDEDPCPEVHGYMAMFHPDLTAEFLET